MLSPRNALGPRSLHGSTTRTILLSPSRTSHSPSSLVFSFHREFSWASKHKNTTSRARKVCKGFSTQDFTGKDMTRKPLYRSTLWGNRHLCRYLPKYAPIREWRVLSSGGKKPESPSSSRNNTGENEEEDWYTRWEKQKWRQYDDFVKKVEHDPYAALFGKSWQNFGGQNTEPKAARTPSPTPPRETSVPKREKPLGNWPSKSRSSSTKISEDRDMYRRPLKSETAPVQAHDQEYEIDPITNRKVFRTSSSPVFTVGHVDPQVKDVEKNFKVFFRHWNLVSPISQDVEQAQALSSSYPPSKDTPLNQHSGNGWLAKEGFGSFQELKADAKPTLQTCDTKPNTTATKIETSLDRQLNSKSINGKEMNDRPQLQYKPEENKAEDVDLLRPTDVRASAGLRGNSPKESDADKQARRQKLEESYKSCSLDRVSQLLGEVASNKLVQKRNDRSVENSTASELRFGSWLKGTLQDTEIKDKEASKDTIAALVNKLSDEKNFDPVPGDQTLESMPLSSEPFNIVDPEAQNKAKDKASKLKAQIVPFKAKLDAMKADYELLRQRWLQEVRIAKERVAKKEAALKAQNMAKRAREVHEEEIRTQKLAMEAMEMRNCDSSTNTAKTAAGKGLGNNDEGEKPAPRRLQSFLQGEGDMASNVHEFAGRDRWYKRKAPHAMDAKDVEMDAKLQKLARDRALIREVRDIYEDTYGTIDTRHRQCQVLPKPLIQKKGHPINASSGSAAGTMAHSRGNESQNSNALEITQRLFSQLREVQTMIQDYLSQASGPSDQNANMMKTPRAFEKSVEEIVETSEQLGRVTPGNMMAQGSAEAIAAATSMKSIIKSPTSMTAPESTNLEIQKTTNLNTYCILAYDSATQKVESAEATTLAPFSKEESLLPLEALNRLSNPGMFLPHVVSLGDKGYEPVSGTSNIIVFKKEIKKTDSSKDPNLTRKLLDHFIGTRDSKWPGLDPIPEKDAQLYCQTQLQGIAAEQQKVKEVQKQATEGTEREHQKVKEAGETAMDGVREKKQAFEEGGKRQFASPASPSNTFSDKVRRQERVFSGSRQGRWVDSSVKVKKSKLAADRPRKTLKHMLMAGGFTAACCYCVGVVSEMMH